MTCTTRTFLFLLLLLLTSSFSASSHFFFFCFLYHSTILPFCRPTLHRFRFRLLAESPDAVTGASGDYPTFGSGVSLVPLILILFMALTTKMVELSLFCGIWLGACILTGSFRAGFESTILDYLVGALADEGHVMVILFTVFLSGVVGMMVRPTTPITTMLCIIP